ncbi:MAG: hypothetical protein WCQ95_10210 [Bacteroidota bacterium]
MQPLFSILLFIHYPFLLNFFLLYIDPGSGSIILQAVIAGVVAVAMFFKYGWHRVKRFFGVKKNDDEDEDQEDSNTK